MKGLGHVAGPITVGSQGSSPDPKGRKYPLALVENTSTEAWNSGSADFIDFWKASVFPGESKPICRKPSYTDA